MADITPLLLLEMNSSWATLQSKNYNNLIRSTEQKDKFYPKKSIWGVDSYMSKDVLLINQIKMIWL